MDAKEQRYWFKCPECGEWGDIDQDQADGKVSIDHTGDGCSFHQTVKVRPLYPSDQPINRNAELVIE